MNKIILDTEGCDRPAAVVRGAARATLSHDVKILLFGKEENIRAALDGVDYRADGIEIRNASDVITNDDTPSLALRKKPDSSLAQAFGALAQDSDAIGLLSCGNTGAVLAGTVFCVGRLPGVLMPTLATLLPTVGERSVCLLDSGANVDCRAGQLAQYAAMGSALMACLYNLDSPRVALVSIGTEDKKGNALTREVFAALKESSLNFVGNMEARDVFTGNYDVLVCDGFVGNVLLKSVEGTARFAANAMAAAIVKKSGGDPAMKAVLSGASQSLNFSSFGAGILLGANKLVMKGHGASDERAVETAISQMIHIHGGGFDTQIRESLSAFADTAAAPTD